MSSPQFRRGPAASQSVVDFCRELAILSRSCLTTKELGDPPTKVISYHSLFPPRSLWSGRLSRRDQDLSESRCRLSWCISSKLASGATVRSIVACNVGNLLVAKICEPGFKLSKHQSLRLRMPRYRTSLGRLRHGANSGSFAPFSARRRFPWVRSCLPARHSGTSGTLHNARYGNTTKLGVCSPRARYSTSIRARSPSRR